MGKNPDNKANIKTYNEKKQSIVQADNSSQQFEVDSNQPGRQRIKDIHKYYKEQLSLLQVQNGNLKEDIKERKRLVLLNQDKLRKKDKEIFRLTKTKKYRNALRKGNFSMKHKLIQKNNTSVNLSLKRKAKSYESKIKNLESNIQQNQKEHKVDLLHQKWYGQSQRNYYQEKIIDLEAEINHLSNVNYEIVRQRDQMVLELEYYQKLFQQQKKYRTIYQQLYQEENRQRQQLEQNIQENEQRQSEEGEAQNEQDEEDKEEQEQDEEQDQDQNEKYDDEQGGKQSSDDYDQGQGSPKQNYQHLRQ